MSAQLILVAPGKPSWVETDLRLFNEIAETQFVDILEGGSGKWIKFLKALSSAHVVCFWFGSFRYYPFILVAKALGRKVMIIAGGYDVESVRGIRYGAFARGPGSRFMRRTLFALADVIAVVSSYSQTRALVNLAQLSQRIRLLNLAVQHSDDRKLTAWESRRRRVALLISADESNLLVKGLDRLAEICRALPDAEFKLAGKLSPEVRSILEQGKPANLEITGFLKFRSPEFMEFLDASRVVLLLSRRESFGAALIDGALLGCRPVAFSVGALPEVVEGFGRLAPDGDMPEMTRVLKNALSEPANVNEIHREAASRFSEARRKAGFVSLLSEIGFRGQA